MPVEEAEPSRPRTARLEGRGGVVAELTSTGAPSRLEAFGLSLLMYPASEAEAGLANVHLRLHGSDGTVRHTPLLGPSAPGRVCVEDDVSTVTGTWSGLDYALTLSLGSQEASWYWRLDVTNQTSREVLVDAVLTHDPALAPISAVRTNEYYVAQYLDITPVPTGDHGIALATRQNMPGPTAPWLLVGSLVHGLAWSTDALQLVTRSAGGTHWTGLGEPSLPSKRLQHEHSLLALQDEPAFIAPGGTHRTGFFGVVLADHPAATGPSDAQVAERVHAEAPVPRPVSPRDVRGTPTPSLFSTATPRVCRALTAAEVDDLAGGPGEDETDRGVLLARSTPTGQLVTMAKDLRVLRPHGHILRTGDTLVPDSASLTSTVWMAGTFASQVTQGHVGRDPLLTGRRTYLGLQRVHGLRILARAQPAAEWTLLETPSAWLVAPDRCTWRYADSSGLVLDISSGAALDRHELTLDIAVREGTAPDLLIALDLGEPDGRTVAEDPGGLRVSATAGRASWRLDWPPGTASVGSLGSAAPDEQRLLVALSLEQATDWSLRLTAEDQTPDQRDDPAPEDHRGARHWHALADALVLDTEASPSSDVGREVADLTEALPWLAQNALVHYLAPRGLEQYSGGAWGTRDVCQGPVGLLTALGEWGALRSVLLRVFTAQNERGDWPQAFDFLPPRSVAGQHDSHGDVIFWPLLAAGDYLLSTHDASLLDEPLPSVGDNGPGPVVPVIEHIAAALRRVEATTIADGTLPAYGHGDWNDALQPADPQMARAMVSTWTAVLQTHSLRTLAAGLAAVGRGEGLAARAADLADRTEEAIRKVLLVDDVLPGYALFHDDGTVEPLVHPRDDRTGLRYGILPWIHAISADLLSPEQATAHLDLVTAHLLGPDGARLFDVPVRYAGGPVSMFQRAEASTFWGREIGLMYVHAHLRYAEALARVGDGRGLLRALALSTPAGLTRRVPQARPRQTTTYSSSSDAAFTDRYDARDRYAAMMAGQVPLEGGWRVYSSGPGLALRLVVECLLGLRARGDRLEVDPVLPPELGTLSAVVPAGGRRLRVTYVIGPQGCGVRAIRVAGADLDLTELANRYRTPGASIRLGDLFGPDTDPREPVDLTVETC